MFQEDHNDKSQYEYHYSYRTLNNHARKVQYSRSHQMNLPIR